jgi:NADP-dependent 3-hydroxy acid dehydrogenase YdfG
MRWAAVAITAAVTIALLTQSDMVQLTAGAGHGAVLITGGGGGIGRAVGEMLEAEGWLVFVTVRKEVRCCAILCNSAQFSQSTSLPHRPTSQSSPPRAD